MWNSPSRQRQPAYAVRTWLLANLACALGALAFDLVLLEDDESLQNAHRVFEANTITHLDKVFDPFVQLDLAVVVEVKPFDPFPEGEGPVM